MNREAAGGPGSSDTPVKSLRPEAGASACGADPVCPIFGKQDPDVHFIAFLFQPVEKASDAVPFSVLPGPHPFDDPFLLTPGHIPPGYIEGNPVTAGGRFEVFLALPERCGLPGFNGAARQGLVRIGNHEVHIEIDYPAESPAFRTRSDGGVEGKCAGHRLLVVNIAGGAMEIGGKLQDGQNRPAVFSKQVDGDPSLPESEGSFKVFDYPASGVIPDFESVLNHLEFRFGFAVEPGVPLGRENVFE